MTLDIPARATRAIIIMIHTYVSDVDQGLRQLSSAVAPMGEPVKLSIHTSAKKMKDDDPGRHTVCGHNHISQSEPRSEQMDGYVSS